MACLSWQEKAQLRVLLTNKVGWKQARNMHFNRVITDAVWRVYEFLWDWGTHRYSGSIGSKHDELFQRHGISFLERRFAKVKRLIKRIMEGEFE